MPERDTVFARVEDLFLVLLRERPGNRLTVTVKLDQEQEWLAERSHEVTFPAGEARASLLIPGRDFNRNVTRSGELTATVADVDGYETADARATVLVVSTEGPFVTYSLSRPSHTFAEDVGLARVQLVARMAPGMPRGVTVGVSPRTRGDDFFSSGYTATPGEDYEPIGGSILLVSSKYELEDGRWVGRTDVIVPILDDDVREGTEDFELNVRPLGRSDKVRLVHPNGSRCLPLCRHRILITDEEDIVERGLVNLEVSQSSVPENARSVGYTVRAVSGGDRQPGAGFSMEVPVRTVEGSASDRVDFTPVSGTVSFARADFNRMEIPAGSGDYFWVAAKQGEVAIADEEEAEEDENFSIVLDPPPTSSGFVLGVAGADVAITNDDRWGFQVEVSPESIREGEEAEVTLTLRVIDKTGGVTRDGHCVAAFPVTASLVPGGTARQADDYTYAVTNGDLSSIRLAGCQPSRRVTLLLSALRDDESEASEDVTFAPSLVDTRLLEPDPGLHRAGALRIENVLAPPRVSFSRSSSTFAETAEDAAVVVVARTDSAAPSGMPVSFSLNSRGGTATSGQDFVPVSEAVTLREQDYAQENGAWVARHPLPLTLLDDRVREGTETLDLILEHAPGRTTDVRFSNPDGSRCEASCAHPVSITDDEDIPRLAISVDREEIGEEGETSVNVTISITNGTTFATDRAFTFRFGGGATEGVDYVVSPSDADGQASGYQVILAAGVTSVVVRITAVDDGVDDPGESFDVHVSLGGDTIGDVSVPIINRPAGPEVAITFEGVRPPRYAYDAGVATGPFLVRITFSEPVQGFGEEDIRWATRAETTVDTTNIAVLLWDYAVTRPGLEYTARMMPDQDGRLNVVVHQGVATSVATGAGNQLGFGSVWVELPPDRLLAEPGTLTVDEGDGDGAQFFVLLTSKPAGPVTATVTGTDGTALAVNKPTVDFSLPYWNGAWLITVTAAEDANAADERMRLRVEASGGGYDGRVAEVVVNVRDNDASASADAPEEDLPGLLEDVTPELAASVLFGQADLKPAQLEALDRLGNDNGQYDLGDLIAWVQRRRDERSRHRRRKRSRTRTGGVGRSGSAWRRPFARRCRRPRRARLALAVLAAVGLTAGCDHNSGPFAPSIGDPGPDGGFMKVELRVPAGTRDLGARLTVEGPDIGSVRATGFELFESDTRTGKQVIVAGTLSAGPILEFRVPDRRLASQYRVRLIEVTGEDYAPRDVSAYAVSISR